MRKSRTKLGKLLLEAGAITGEQLQSVLEEQPPAGARLGKLIVSKGYLTEEDLCSILAAQLGIEAVNLDQVSPPKSLMLKIPEPLAKKHSVFPIGYSDGKVRLAVADPLNIDALDEISARLSSKVETLIAQEREIEAAIKRFYGPESFGDLQSDLPVIEPALPKAGEDEAKGSVARNVESLLARAVAEGASDIHIEPGEEKYGIRFRIDGVMRGAGHLNKPLALAIVSRLKIVAGMDISETRAPQDGGFSIELSGANREFRVCSYPTIFGECVVVRVLGYDTPMNIGGAGLSGSALDGFLKAVKSPWGLVVVTGPTGAGKTTTLYAALSEISSTAKTVISIEDPVEYRLPNVRQTQINSKAGLTFASGLRSALRQDPDVIMVGEVRDQETAAIAVQAAMTGRLVLTTMHTTDAASAFTRLMDLGLEPYKIASTVRGALAQRLVRRICQACAGCGCQGCRGYGYLGRTGVFEFIGPDDGFMRLVSSRPSASALRMYAQKYLNMASMLEEARRKAAEGITSMEEVDRIMGNE